MIEDFMLSGNDETDIRQQGSIPISLAAVRPVVYAPLG
jgi:hypothetical protein